MGMELYKCFLDFGEVAREHEDDQIRRVATWEAIRASEILFGMMHFGDDATVAKRGWVQRERILFVKGKDRHHLELAVNSVPNIHDAWDHITFYERGGKIVGIVTQPYGDNLPSDGQSEHAIWTRHDELSFWYPPRTGLLLIRPIDILETIGVAK